MKNINQIFKNNPDLMVEPEVLELIEYCRNLEGQVMDHTQQEIYNKEDKLSELVRDVYQSCRMLKVESDQHDRWPNDFPEPDYKQSISNLNQYIVKFSIDNNFRL